MTQVLKIKKLNIYLVLAVFSGLLLMPVYVNHVQAQSNLSATCFVHPISVNVGEQAIWTVIASGGTGFYQYSWSGTDGLSGNTYSVAKVYGDDGKKTATVTVTSGGQTVTPTCNLEVEEVSEPISASCFAQSSFVYKSQEVNWITEVSGGSGGHKYLWNGTDDLQGTNKKLSKKYDSTGLKQATVTITSGNQSMVRTCTVNIVADPPLSGQCLADFSSISTGQSVTWTAQSSGGIGEYKYSWNGSENLSGSKQAVSKTYDTFGQKTANVQITSGDQTIIRSCAVNVGAVSGAFTGTPSSASVGTLQVSCFANPLSIEIGEQANWTAVASGGSGSYNYLWTGSNGLSGNSQSVSKAYNTAGIKTATVTVNSGIYSAVSSCTFQVFEKGFLPTDQSGVVLGQLPYTGITISKWKIFSTMFLAIVLTIILSIASVIKKKSKEKKKGLAFAYDGVGIEKDISDIIQKECQKSKVMISTDAIKEIMNKSRRDISQSIKNLKMIIVDLKELPLPMVCGEERCLVIDKKEVDGYFLKSGVSHDVDN